MKAIIQDFVDNKTLAIAGVSRDSKKWGSMLFKALKKKGYHIYPVNPNMEEFEGEKCYTSISELPAEVSNLIVTTSPDVTLRLVKECKGSGIKNIWMHQGAGGTGAQSQEAIDFCKENNLGVVYGFCPMMFFPPVGGHKLHYWIKKITRKFPQEYLSQN
jgi:predicted CoA-binding protein